MSLPSRLPIDSMSNPFTHSINPPAPSSFQPYNYHNNYIDSPQSHRKQPNISSSRNHMPTQTLNLNDNLSFARNFKGRLYNSDPQEEDSKQRAAEKYRQQLRIQMQEDKRRKAAQKAKEEEEDLKLQKKFYDNIKIEAQQKGNKKQQPNYFVMRSAKGRRKDKNDEQKLASSAVLDSRIEQFAKKDNLKRTLYQQPKIVKRGGYHNQSSLDHTKNYPVDPNSQEKIKTFADMQSTQSGFPPNLNNPPLIVKMTETQILKQQMAEEQNRISKLLLFQQNMLKKLDYFKKQIYQTDRALRLEEELEKVKLKLRSKHLNMHNVHSLSVEGVDDILQQSEMYQLPVISKKKKVYQGEREARRKKAKTPYHRVNSLEEQPKQQVNLRDRQSSYNDKNIPAVHEDVPQFEAGGQLPLNPEVSETEVIPLQAQF